MFLDTVEEDYRDVYVAVFVSVYYLHFTIKHLTLKKPHILHKGCLIKNVTPIFLYISICINASVLCFIWAEIEGPPVRLAYRNMSDVREISGS